MFILVYTSSWNKPVYWIVKCPSFVVSVISPLGFISGVGEFRQSLRTNWTLYFTIRDHIGLWHSKADNSAHILKALNYGHFPNEFNHTHIVLIPKTKNRELIQEFRPISLCNVIYKLMSKCIASRSKQALSHIISVNQNSFTPKHLIMHDVLIAVETLHYLNYKYRCQKGNIALKLEMSKTYDRIKWNFLEKIMMILGFHERWVHFIKKCIKSLIQ